MAISALADFVAMAMRSDHDPLSALVAYEREKNPEGEVIRPGHRLLPAADWKEGIVTLSGPTARIILVHARREGAGAFTRLLSALDLAGVSPVVIDPTLELQATLKRRGWSGKRVGNSFDDREFQWFPPVAYQARGAR